MNRDLKWLAENISEWNEDAVAVQELSGRVSWLWGDDPAEYNGIGEIAFTKEQWEEAGETLKSEIDVKNAKCFKEVAEVIGEEAAEKELKKVADACSDFDSDFSLASAFVWKDTPQGEDFWCDIQCGYFPIARTMDAPDEMETAVPEDKPTAHDIVKMAMKHMEDRAATYDKPEGERSIGATVDAFNAVTGDGLMNSEERGWLFMVLLKIVRSQQGDFKLDNYEDLSAYGGLMGEAAAKERG